MYYLNISQHMNMDLLYYHHNAYCLLTLDCIIVSINFKLLCHAHNLLYLYNTQLGKCSHIDVFL